MNGNNSWPPVVCSGFYQFLHIRIEITPGVKLRDNNGPTRGKKQYIQSSAMSIGTLSIFPMHFMLYHILLKNSSGVNSEPILMKFSPLKTKEIIVFYNNFPVLL